MVSIKVIEINLKELYFLIVSKIHKLFYDIIKSNRIVKLLSILSHVIPGNDIADDLIKMAFNNSKMTNLSLEYEKYYSLLKKSFKFNL